MEYSTTVKVVLEEDRSVPLPGVKVALFDHDRFSRDDGLGRGVTDANGEAVFRYSTDDFADLEDSGRDAFPELYAVVYAADDTELATTRPDAAPNWARRHITVPVARATAERHGLLGG